jgi:hypothetical protein
VGQIGYKNINICKASNILIEGVASGHDAGAGIDVGTFLAEKRADCRAHIIGALGYEYRFSAESVWHANYLLASLWPR